MLKEGSLHDNTICNSQPGMPSKNLAPKPSTLRNQKLLAFICQLSHKVIASSDKRYTLTLSTVQKYSPSSWIQCDQKDKSISALLLCLLQGELVSANRYKNKFMRGSLVAEYMCIALKFKVRILTSHARGGGGEGGGTQCWYWQSCHVCFIHRAE